MDQQRTREAVDGGDLKRSGRRAARVHRSWADEGKTMIHDDVVTVLLADTLTKGERRLVENGHAERILGLRHDFQQVMRADLIEIVERHLGRKVIAFMSQNHIDPDLAVEVFVLEPGAAA